MQGIAIYIRLSCADEETGREKDESNSIVNQRSLIHGFLDRNEEFAGLTRIEFIDDGFSGTKTNRPAFVEMINKMREGCFSVCISKDFSRLFRDYIEMGECIERTFPLLHIRYISINDHYDSNDFKGTVGGMDVVFKNFINASYSRDISVKVSSVKIQLARKGRRTWGYPPYGYMPDPKKTGFDLIDPDSSKVVRRIFNEALNGNKPGHIAKMLNREGIDSPSVYFRKQHPESKRFSNIDSNRSWTGNYVRRILERLEYTGAFIYGQTKRVTPCGGDRVFNDKKDWIVVKGMHEAIITGEEYEKVQKMIHKNKKITRSNKTYALKSLVICGCCGRAMKRISYNSGYFKCNHMYDDDNSPCKGVISPKEHKLESIVYDAICGYTEMTGMNIKKIKKKARDEKSSVRETESRIFCLKRELEKRKDERLKAYERFISGEISKDEYLEEKMAINAILAGVESELDEAELVIKALSETEDGIFSEAEAACKAYEGEDHLTYEMAHAFVDKIFIYSEDRIEIKWRFKDLFADKIREMQEQGLIEN